MKRPSGWMFHARCHARIDSFRIWDLTSDRGTWLLIIVLCSAAFLAASLAALSAISLAARPACPATHSISTKLRSHGQGVTNQQRFHRMHNCEACGACGKLVEPCGKVVERLWNLWKTTVPEQICQRKGTPTVMQPT